MLRLPKVSRQAVHGAESGTAFAKVGLFEHYMYILSKGQVMHLVISWQQGWGGGNAQLQWGELLFSRFMIHFFIERCVSISVSAAILIKSDGVNVSGP